MNGSMTVNLPGKTRRRSRSSNKKSEKVDVVRRVRAMPSEVGFLLIVSGIGGILLPGPVGTPFLILGCLVLWPKAFQSTGQCFEKYLPHDAPSRSHSNQSLFGRS